MAKAEVRSKELNSNHPVVGLTNLGSGSWHMATHPYPPTGASPHTGAVAGYDETAALLKRVAWGAVIAGVVFSLVVHLLLNMLGVGIGLMTVEPTDNATPAAGTFGIAAGIWWAVAGIIAALAGGYVAGRLSGKPHAPTAGWHGVITWATTTLVIFYLLGTTVGGVIGGAFNVVGNAVTGLGQAVAEAAPAAAEAVGGPGEDISQQIAELTGAASDDPAAIREATTSAIARLITSDEPAEDARQEAAASLARVTDLTPEQALARIDQWQAEYRQAADQAAQQAAEAAEATAGAISMAALLGFVALVLGGVAGWFGGRMGTPRAGLT